MTIKVTGKFLDNKSITISANKIFELNTQWKKISKNNKNIPDELSIVYSNDLVIICPIWTLGKSKKLPGSGGFNSEKNPVGTDRIFKINVISDEYPYSVINNDYTVVLSKQKYTPTVIDTNGFYVALIGCETISDSQDLYFYMYTKEFKQAPEITYEFFKLSDIYDNPIITIAKLCNALGNIDRRFSFKINSANNFTFYWSISDKTDEFPILYTESPKYINVFTPEYFSDDFYYYTNTLQWWYSTFSQTIELKEPTDNSVIINNKTYFASGSPKDFDITFTPTTSPANIPVEDYLLLSIKKEETEKNNTLWIIIIIVCAIIILIFILIKSLSKKNKQIYYTKYYKQ